MTREEIKELLEQGYSKDQIAGMLAVQPEEPKIGLGGTARLALGQGLAFGWGDEIEAFARSLGSDRSYEEIRDQIRAENEAIREAHPGTALALEVAGGALTGGVGAGRAMAGAAARSMGRNLLRAGGTGAAVGAAGGLGAGEGDPMQQAASAATGAALGGALGVGASGVGQVVAGRLPGSQAGQILAERLGDETPEAIAARVASMGPGATVMEATPAMRGLGAYLANRPGPTEALRDILTDREMGKAPIIEDALRRAMGVQGDPRAIEAATRQARRVQAKSDYDALLTTPFRPTPAMLDELALETAADRAALKSTKRALKNAGLAWDIDDDQLRRLAGYWDYFSRELGDRAVTETGKLKAGGAPLLEAKDQLDAALNSGTGGQLSRVREAYAQASVGLDAYKQAEKFLNIPSDEALDLIRGLDPEQRRLYAAGVTRALLYKLEGTPETANTAWNLIKSPRTEKKMRALLGDEEYVNWERAMRNLMEQTESFNVAARGSRTAPMMMQGDALGASVLGDLLRGDFGAAARGTLAHVLPGQVGMSPRAAADLFALYQANPMELAPMMQAMLRGGYPTALPGIAAGGGVMGAMPFIGD